MLGRAVGMIGKEVYKDRLWWVTSTWCSVRWWTCVERVCVERVC